MDAQKDKSNTKQIPMWFWLVLPFLLIFAQTIFEVQGTEQLAYSDFKHLLAAGKVDGLAITSDAIKGMLTVDGLDKVLAKARADALQATHAKELPFITVRVNDPGLIDDMEAAGVH